MPTVRPTSICDNTAAGAHAFLEHVKRAVRYMFRQKGTLAPVAFMVGNRNPVTCEMLDEEAMSALPLDPRFLENNETKDRLAEALNGLAISAGAFGMAFVNEAWLRKFPTHEEMEEYCKSGASLNDDEQAALREEGIILAYEHRALPAGEQTIGAWAKILRPGRGKPRLGPWATDHGLEGRFVGLLPGDEYLNRTALVLDELVKGAMSMGIGKEKAAEILARGRWHQRGYPPPAWLAQRIREMEW